MEEPEFDPGGSTGGNTGAGTAKYYGSWPSEGHLQSVRKTCRKDSDGLTHTTVETYKGKPADMEAVYASKCASVGRGTVDLVTYRNGTAEVVVTFEASSTLSQSNSPQTHMSVSKAADGSERHVWEYTCRGRTDTFAAVSCGASAVTYDSDNFTSTGWVREEDTIEGPDSGARYPWTHYVRFGCNITPIEGGEE